MTKRIMILGGGFAGLFAARELRRRLGSRAEIELVNAENYFVFQPLLPEVAAGAISAQHAVTPLRFLLDGVRVRKARVDRVDLDKREVTLFQGVQRRPTPVQYDHLVVALGQEADLSRTPGLTEHALTMKSLEDARRLRSHVIERLEHADITQLPDVRREALTFVVIGAGFSGIETVGEMKELIDRTVRFYPNIDPSEIRVIVLEFADRILGEMPRPLADYAAKQLEKRGIEVKLNVGAASATGTALETTDGEVIGTRTIVATIGNTPAPVVKAMGLTLEHGRVAVDRTLRCVNRDNVWSLGDCALIPMKDGATERGDFAPPTAQFAVREARLLAANLDRALEGRALEPFEYTSKGALASLGARRGIAQVMGMNLTGLPAWLLWRAYYVAFLPGMATRARVLFNWLMDGLSPRSVVQERVDGRGVIRHVHYRAGDRIYEAGNRADGFYTVVSGAVEVMRADKETGERRPHHIGPGGHIGERLILGEDRRISTARAAEDTVVLVVEREAFVDLCNAFPALNSYFQEHLRREGLDQPVRDAAE